MASLALSETSKAELLQKLERARAVVKNAKVHMQRTAKHGVAGGCAAMGGALAGVLSVEMPNLPGTQIPSDLGLGGLLCAAAMAGLVDGYDDEIVSIGGGMIAVGVSREVAKAWVARKQ